MNDDAVESYLRTMDPAAMEAMLRRVGRVEAPVRCRASIHSTQAAHDTTHTRSLPIPIGPSPSRVPPESSPQRLVCTPRGPAHLPTFTRSARSPLSHSFPTASLSLSPYPPYPILLVGTPRATLRWHYRRPTRIPLQSRAIDALYIYVHVWSMGSDRDARISRQARYVVRYARPLLEQPTRVAGSFTSYLNVYL